MLPLHSSKPLLSSARLRSSSLSTLASAARAVPHPPDLVRWVRQQGGSVHPSISVADDRGGLGVVSTAGIVAGEELIELPGHVPLRWTDGTGPMLSRIAERVPEELWSMRLGLRLLQERAKEDSFWWPYISNLPQTFTLPIFFNGDEIKALQYAPILHQVNKRCRFLINFDKEIKTLLSSLSPSEPHPFEGKDVNSSSLGCAMSAVSSRAFRLHGKGDSVVPMLLPLIDMCNHSFTPNACIVQDRDASSPNLSIKVVANNQIEQNTAVTLNYGNLSNDFLLLDYGFVVRSNPNDRVELRYDSALLEAASMTAGVSSPGFSSPATWQQEILGKLNLEGDNAKVTLGGPDLIDGRLIAALRVLFSPKTLKTQDLNSLTILGDESNPPFGSSVEISALKTVIALCVISLEHFPTKIMEDEETLKLEISSATRLAVEFRLEKKLMLVDVMRKLSKRVRVLDKEKSVR